LTFNMLKTSVTHECMEAALQASDVPTSKSVVASSFPWSFLGLGLFSGCCEANRAKECKCCGSDPAIGCTAFHGCGPSPLPVCVDDEGYGITPVSSPIMLHRAVLGGIPSAMAVATSEEILTVNAVTKDFEYLNHEDVLHSPLIKRKPLDSVPSTISSMTGMMGGGGHAGPLSGDGPKPLMKRRPFGDSVSSSAVSAADVSEGPMSMDGYHYEGALGEKNLASGHGRLYIGGQLAYEGQWRSGMRHGEGHENRDDGMYDGQHRDNQRHGHGVCYFADGTWYDGQWEVGVLHGAGLLVYEDGRHYDGQFEHGQMHGEGVFRWPDRRHYTGSYYQGKKHGHGVFQWADGRTYDGSWSDGRQHGEGKFTNALGEIYTGLWRQGRRVKWIL